MLFPFLRISEWVSSRLKGIILGVHWFVLGVKMRSICCCCSFFMRKWSSRHKMLSWELTAPEHWYPRVRQGSRWAVLDEWWKVTSVTSLLSGWCQGWLPVIWRKPCCFSMKRGYEHRQKSLVPVFVSEGWLWMSLLGIVLLGKTGLVPSRSLQCLQILNWEWQSICKWITGKSDGPEWMQRASSWLFSSPLSEPCLIWTALHGLGKRWCL